MMTRFTCLLLATIVTSAAMAQTVYRWVDENGEVHYGHAVPAEHAHRGYDRLRRDGTVRERVAPAMSPEERAERAERLAREAEMEAEQRSQESRDRMLLASYRSEEDIINTMEIQIARVDAQRDNVNADLDRVTQRFETLIGQAAEETREGRIVPEQLRQNIQASRDRMAELRDRLDELDDEEEGLRNNYAAQLERFRELTGFGQQ
jgi:chromosome segregation ATPase